MKLTSKLNFLTFFFLTLFSVLSAQPCIDCLDEPFEPVCVEDANGDIIPFPNACFAECEGYTDYSDCDLGSGGGDPNPCDCPGDFDPVCVDDGDGNELFFPNACFAECEGFTEDDFIECGVVIPGDDCIECLDEPIDPVCVEVEPGHYCPFPNPCYAECAGYTVDDFVDCDSVGVGGGGLDCIECLEEPIDPVCVDDGDGNVIPFPNACFAECEGFTEDDFVECDSIGINPCDCPGDFDPVCVEDEEGNQLFFPNACIAECEGFTSDDFVDCDNGGGLGCIECFDEPFDPVCVEDADGTTIPYPNACFAECEGYTSDDFVECDLGTGGGNPNPCDCPGDFDPVCVEDEDGFELFFPNACFAECEGFTEDDFIDCDSVIVIGDDCIECLDEPIDPVCVEVEPGHYCPFPNPCYAECAGYTIDDFVDCDSVGIGTGGGLDCIECLEEPIDPVCVEDADGNILPYPNACFAECDGFTSDDLVDCDGFGNGNGGNQFTDREIVMFEVSPIGNISTSPNPVINNLTVQFKSGVEEETIGKLKVYSLQGQEMIHQKVQIFTGNNSIQVNTSTLLSGIYLLSLETENDVKTVKFVK